MNPRPALSGCPPNRVRPKGRDKLNEYNTLLSDADSALNQLEALESTISDLSDRMLKGVASRYGRDSDEYEKAGGTRKSDIKRSPRKKAAEAEGTGRNDHAVGRGSC